MHAQREQQDNKLNNSDKKCSIHNNRMVAQEDVLPGSSRSLVASEFEFRNYFSTTLRVQEFPALTKAGNCSPCSDVLNSYQMSCKVAHMTRQQIRK